MGGVAGAIALDQLPDEERQVVRLSWFDGLAHSEIADKLGVPVGTVKSRSHRATADSPNCSPTCATFCDPPTTRREPINAVERRDR